LTGRYLACEKLCHLFPKVLFWQNEEETSSPRLIWKTAMKMKMGCSGRFAGIKETKETL